MNKSTQRRVVVTQRFFDDKAIAYLRDNGCDVMIAELPRGEADRNLTHAHLADLLNGATGWIVGHAKVTKDLLAELPDLLVISRRGVGYERVDIQGARELGRVVAIAAGGNDASVADHTIGLMLAVARRLRESQNLMLNGNWSILTSSDLYQKTVGVVGMGRIAKSVVQRLGGFDVRLLASTPRLDEEFGMGNGIEYVGLERLLRESDYITLHAPLTPQTRFMINAASIATMKTSAILINTARGGLIDDRDLLAALKAGRLAGAGLDVYLSESDAALKSVTEELIALPNVIATPHSAASSLEGLARTNMIAARSVIAVLDGGTPDKACVIADGRSGAEGQ